MLIYKLVTRVRIGVTRFVENTAIGGEITYKSAENYGVHIKQRTTYTLPPARYMGKIDFGVVNGSTIEEYY